MISKKQKEQKQKKNINFKILNRVLLISVILLGAYYLIGTNDLAIKSFVLQGEKKKLRELTDKNTDYSLRAMSLSSFNQLSERINGLKMVKIDKVDYLAGPGAVAMNR